MKDEMLLQYVTFVDSSSLAFDECLKQYLDINLDSDKSVETTKEVTAA